MRVTFVAIVLPLILLSNLTLIPPEGIGEQVSFDTPVTSFDSRADSSALLQSSKENVHKGFVQLPEQQVMLPDRSAFRE